MSSSAVSAPATASPYRQQPVRSLPRLDLVASEKVLGNGIGAALSDSKKLRVFPTEMALDLLVLAAHIHAADTRISRWTESQDTWTREIRLVVPVSDPTRWTAAAPTLRRILNFLTGDRWNSRLPQSSD